jgi:hypothetical protein
MKAHKKIPLDLVAKFFDYNEISGVLTWAKQRGRRGKKGLQAGYFDGEGYLRVRIGKSAYFGHRVVWAVHYGEDPGDMEVDHINCLPFDNRIQNLRLCIRSENARNTKIRKNNSSGLKGVYFKISDEKWVAQICKDGSVIHLGRFDAPGDASCAYNEASKLLHGRFGRTS